MNSEIISYDLTGEYKISFLTKKQTGRVHLYPDNKILGTLEESIDGKCPNKRLILGYHEYKTVPMVRLLMMSERSNEQSFLHMFSLVYEDALLLDKLLGTYVGRWFLIPKKTNLANSISLINDFYDEESINNLDEKFKKLGSDEIKSKYLVPYEVHKILKLTEQAHCISYIDFSNPVVIK